MFLTGVLQALGMVFLTSIGFVILRFASTVYAVNPILYTIIAFMTASLMLTLIAGPGKYAVASIKSKSSWYYSFCLIGMAIAQLFLVKYVSGTEVMIFDNIAIPLSVAIAAILLKRKQQMVDLIGMLILIIGLYVAFAIQENNFYIILYLALTVGVFNTLMTISAELHSQSKKAHEEGYIRDKIRVVAFVSFISSLTFMFVALIVSVLKTYYLPENISNALNFVPNINNFIDLPTVILGILMGVLVIPVNRYLKWASAYNIKSENLLSILALTPLVTMFCEWLLSFTNIVKTNIINLENSPLILLAVILNIIGAGLPVFAKVYKNYIELKKSGLTLKQQFKKANNFNSTGLVINMTENNQDYEIILATVKHCKDDTKLAAEILDIPQTTLEVIYNGRGDYVLNDEMSNLININFREKIVLSDSLTGLHNRTALMTALEKLYKDKIDFSLVFIDIDNFKNINDNYGHKAGDTALIKVAEKLQSFANGECYAARFAGDEFCLLIPYAKKESSELIPLLKNDLTISFKQNNATIDFTASLGIASSKEYNTAEDLINSADEVMYRNKV